MSRQELLRELAGRKCICGKTKKAKQTFCYGCYRRLPHELKHSLYRRFGEGYEEAYAASERILRGKEGA